MENAIQIAKSHATGRAMRRNRSGLSRTGAIASRTSTKGRPPPERGSSNRSQSTAITSPARPATTTVLSMGRLERALQTRCEVIAVAHHRNRHAGRVQAQELGFRLPGHSVEARRVDVDKRDLAA